MQKQIMSPAIPMYYSAPTIIDSNIFFVAGDDRHTEDGANVLNCLFPFRGAEGEERLASCFVS